MEAENVKRECCGDNNQSLPLTIETVEKQQKHIKHTSKNIKRIGIILIIVVLLLIVCMGGGMYFSKNDCHKSVSKSKKFSSSLSSMFENHLHQMSFDPDFIKKAMASFNSDMKKKIDFKGKLEFCTEKSYIDLDEYQNIITFLCSSGSNPNFKNADGQSLLHYAVHYKFSELARVLIELGADVNVLNADYRTPYYCINEDQFEEEDEDEKDQMKSILKNAGASLDLFTTDSSLFHACINESIEQISLLITQTPNLINLKVSPDHMTPLQTALFYGRVDVADLLFKNGAKIFNYGDDLNSLHYACSSGNLAAVKWVFENYPDLNPNCKSLQNLTALYYSFVEVLSTTEQKIEIIKFLLDKGADRNVKNTQGFIPSIYAILYNDTEIQNLLQTQTN